MPRPSAQVVFDDYVRCLVTMHAAHITLHRERDAHVFADEKRAKVTPEAYMTLEKCTFGRFRKGLYLG